MLGRPGVVSALASDLAGALVRIRLDDHQLSPVDAGPLAPVDERRGDRVERAADRVVDYRDTRRACPKQTLSGSCGSRCSQARSSASISAGPGG
jgi:hypothetical protein